MQLYVFGTLKVSFYEMPGHFYRTIKQVILIQIAKNFNTIL